jgi:hypothetical protein
MQTSDDQAAPPLHPFRESAAFLRAAAAAVARLFWPGRRRTPTGFETPVSEAEPVHLRLKEKSTCIAPYPVNE